MPTQRNTQEPKYYLTYYYSLNQPGAMGRITEAQASTPSQRGLGAVRLIHPVYQRP